MSHKVFFDYIRKIQNKKLGNNSGSLSQKRMVLIQLYLGVQENWQQDK